MTDIPADVLFRAKEIYESNWPDPVLAIAEALMKASNTPPAQMSTQALAAHIAELQLVLNEKRETASW